MECHLFLANYFNLCIVSKWLDSNWFFFSVYLAEKEKLAFFACVFFLLIHFNTISKIRIDDASQS